MTSIRGRIRGQRLLHALLAAWTVCTYLFLLAPVLVVVILAFNASPSNTFPVTGVTLRWFGEVGRDGAIVSSVRTSLALAGLAGISATLVGTAAAFALSRLRFRGREAVQLMLTLPILVPHIVLGVGLLLAFRLAGLSKSFVLLVIGHVAIILPFVVLTTSHRLKAIPPNIEEAARTLGASPFEAFRTITLPLALPAVLSSLVFAFMSSFDEVTATLFWLPPNIETVQSHILALLQYSVDQKVNALATLLILASVSLAGLAIFLARVMNGKSRP